MKFNIFRKILAIALLNISIFNCNPTIVSSAEKSDSSEKKVVYLTFDDGPAGKVTTNILDILKENSVNATFFLIGEQIKGQEELVKRIYNEGHAIGLHSMTHKKDHLYCSNKDFLNEMLEDQNLISSIIPVKPKIIRFPFGCNNNTYKLSQSMVDLLHENDLKIYDWNTDSGDGANPNSPPHKLVKNATTDKNRVVLLMHCGYLSKNSVKALPSIIKYYKDNGYEFSIIDENTPEEFHILNKK